AQAPPKADITATPACREILNHHSRARVHDARGRKEVRFETPDRRALVEADLRDAPPRLDVGSLDPDDLFGLQVEVFPGAELRLAVLIGEDAGEDRFLIAVHLDLPPLDGEDPGGHRNVRGPLPQ